MQLGLKCLNLLEQPSARFDVGDQHVDPYAASDVEDFQRIPGEEYAVAVGPQGLFHELLKRCALLDDHDRRGSCARHPPTFAGAGGVGQTQMG